jgi:hypothetical protein
VAGKPAFAWFGPASGILFVVLLGVAFATGSVANADPEGSAATIAAELEAAQDGASAFFGLFVLSVFFFLFFLAYLRDRLAHVGDEGAWLVSVLWGSGLLFAAMALLIGSVQAAQFVVSDYGPDTQVAKTLAVIGWDNLLVLGPPVGAFGASAAVLILRFKVLPWWLGALAVLVFLSGFAPWMSPAVLLPWVVLTSIVLLVEERKRPTAANA